MTKKKREENSPASMFLLSSQYNSIKNHTNSNTMIRVFNAFGKSFFQTKSDLMIFNNFMDTFQVDKATCPHCGAKYNCTFFSTYSRNMITFENSSNTCHNISITRIICNSCNRTHAILPENLIPYGSYSLSFVLTALRAYFLGTKTAILLCDYFQISISTLYDWIKLFKEQKLLWLGVLDDAITLPVKFIDDLFSLKVSLYLFFKKINVSFLEPFKTTHFNSS